MIKAILEWRKKRFIILFISLILSLVGGAFVPLEYQSSFRSVFILQNVAIALSVYIKDKKTIYLYGSIVLFLLIAEVIKNYTDLHIQIFETVLGFSYIIFYLIISTLVFKYIFKNENYDYGIIFPVFCSYLLLGILSSFIFITIEILTPGSFQGLKQGLSLEGNLSYFSFTTLLTIGFGDISPVTSAATNATVFVGLAGHFYMIFVTGVVIVKYYKNKQTE